MLRPLSAREVHGQSHQLAADPLAAVAFADKKDFELEAVSAATDGLALQRRHAHDHAPVKSAEIPSLI